MNSKKLALLIAIAHCLLCPLVVGAQDNSMSRTEVAISLKAWDASWLSYIPTTAVGVNSLGAPRPVNIYDQAEADRSWDLLPSISIRYKDFFGSASYGRFSNDFRTDNAIIATSAGTNVITTRTDHLRRTETDLSGGYFITPNVALTVTYKYGTEDRDVTTGLAPGSERLSETRANALLFGALAAFPVAQKFGVYGQFAYGPSRARYTSKSAQNTVTLGQTIDLNGKYLITEVGVTYQLPAEDLKLRQSTIGLGYRSQTITTFGRPISGNRDLRDTRDGLVLSINGSF